MAELKPNLSKFDADPEAIAWAREKIESLVKKLERFSEEFLESGDGDNAHQYRKFANIIRMDLLGGGICVIAAFDTRLPAIMSLLEKEEQQ